jgi:DMSO/TMAO reductase YedYZ heme-binding membrane subunit
VNSPSRRIAAACAFGLIYASGAAFAYARGMRVFLFHFCFAAVSAWGFFEVSGVLEGRRDRATLSHRLIKWPAFILLVCLAAAACLRWAGWPEWFRPVALPALAALAVLAGGVGGYLSLLLRR